jgi:hypothetical protein
MWQSHRFNKTDGLKTLFNYSTAVDILLTPSRSQRHDEKREMTRREDARSPLSASCLRISNPTSLSINATRVDSRIRSWKSTHLQELDVWKPLVVSILQRSEKLRLYNLFRSWHFQTPGLKAVSSNASTDWTVRFLEGDDRGLLKEGFKIYLMAPMSPLSSPTVFLFAHL